MKSINPFTSMILQEFDELSDAVVAEKLRQSSSCFESFRKTDFVYRKFNMNRLAELLETESEYLAKTISSEMGKPLKESVAEVKKCAWVCRFYAEKAGDFLQIRMVETDAEKSYVMYQPLGPLLGIMPWNFPFWQVFRFAAPAVMAGNTILLKHASNVQACAHQIEKLFLRAGFDQGVFQNLCISSHRVGEVITSPHVKAISLTGSGPAGAAVAQLAGSCIKKCVLELGGNNAFVILSDANLEKAAEVAVAARLQNAGQSCIAAKRFILEDAIHDSFLELLMQRMKNYRVEDPMLPSTRLGPLATLAQAEDLRNQVVDSQRQGAEIILKGRMDGTFFDPLIMTGVRPGMKVFDEELFGPVFAVTKVRNPEEALGLSNRSAFGLGISIFTTSPEKAEYFIENADEGAVFINSLVKSDPRLPFGGVKTSGYGRELSEEGIREFVNIKTVFRLP